MRRFIPLFALGIGLASCAFTAVAPFLVYNGSLSVPVGFYVRTDEPARIGAFVTVRAANVAPFYAALRHFDGPRNWFIKRVAAGGGAHICAAGSSVTVNGQSLTRWSHDRARRALPAWSGCRVLADDELFLVGDTLDSFDSRYWGPVRRRDIDGVWRRL